mmetsp:Transcript_81177/g.263069  ORF Transcript_81177/g.263069 Transcript_81177/m.263069 type:complete len:211 (-) Transcript_81177:1842-2474(-)
MVSGCRTRLLNQMIALSIGLASEGQLSWLATKCSASGLAKSMGSTQISVKRFLRAGDNSLLPKSPPGFMVAKSLKVSFALTTSKFKLVSGFSANNRNRSGSSTEFNLSSTESSAREISSIKNPPPARMASTSAPSAHSKILSQAPHNPNKWRANAIELSAPAICGVATSNGESTLFAFPTPTRRLLLSGSSLAVSGKSAFGQRASATRSA